MSSKHEAVFLGKEEKVVYNLNPSWLTGFPGYTRYTVKLNTLRKPISSKDIVLYEGEVQGDQLESGDTMMLPNLGIIEVCEVTKKPDGTVVYYTDYRKEEFSNDPTESISRVMRDAEKYVNEKISNVVTVYEDELRSLKKEKNREEDVEEKRHTSIFGFRENGKRR
ncbi:hypothetical protein 015DV004_58 [Bacillus phage 015DV004]|nr:hypothetical protein 015DV004_58 [Bacillus phage 015DV004]